MQKMDLKKELKHLYQPSAKEVVQVDVPTFQFLMIDGEGDPNTSKDYEEGPTIQKVHAFIQNASLGHRGHGITNPCAAGGHHRVRRHGRAGAGVRHARFEPQSCKRSSQPTGRAGHRWLE